MQALIIDDSPVVRRIIRGYLTPLDFDVCEAADGIDGLDKLRDMPDPGLVVVDWNMPELDGIGFIERMRAQSIYDQVPVLMVTTESELTSVERALAAGASEYVMKPFTKEMLLEKLAILGVGPA